MKMGKNFGNSIPRLVTRLKTRLRSVSKHTTQAELCLLFSHLEYTKVV